MNVDHFGPAIGNNGLGDWLRSDVADDQTLCSATILRASTSCNAYRPSDLRLINLDSNVLCDDSTCQYKLSCMSATLLSVFGVHTATSLRGAQGVMIVGDTASGIRLLSGQRIASVQLSCFFLLLSGQGKTLALCHTISETEHVIGQMVKLLFF